MTRRSTVVGLAAVLLLCAWATHAEMVVRSSRLTLAHFPLGLMALLLALLGLNRWLRLSPKELLVVVSMGLVGAVVPVEGVVGFLLGIISSFHYFASPENQWAEYFLPHLPRWLIPQGSPEAWNQFFENAGSDRSIPWGMWAPPLLWWVAFVLATLWVTACLMVILRRQWQEHERLVYPLATVALRLVEPGGLYRQRLFQAGASIPLVVLTWEMLSWFQSVPLPMTGVYGYRPLTLVKGAIPLIINPFQFFSIGFGFFANTDVLLSIWLFFLVHVAQSGVFHRFGFTLGGIGGDEFSASPVPLGWQGFGAFCFMVLWGLWVARRHLREVVREGLSRGRQETARLSSPQKPDTSEMLSYRTAVVGGSAGALFMLLWLAASGMTLLEGSLFLFATLTIYIGMGRIVAETGVLYTWGTLSPQSLVFSVVGTEAMAGQSAVAVLLSYSLINYLRGLFAPALAHVTRFGATFAAPSVDGPSPEPRRLMWRVILGTAAAVVFSFWFTLTLCYDNGAYNTFGWPHFFSGNPKGMFSDTLSKVRNPFPTDWARIGFAGIGAAVMALLTTLRTRVTWWRLHPVGFAMSAMINTEHLALPVFIAWSIKSVVLAVGGVQLYRRTTPFFLGMIVGYAIGVSACSVVDAVWFPGQGHLVHDW